MDPVRATVFLPRDMYLAIGKQAKKAGASTSGYLRDAIIKGLGLEVKDDHGAKSKTRTARKKVEAV
jgi:hypothetical protein